MTCFVVCVLVVMCCSGVVCDVSGVTCGCEFGGLFVLTCFGVVCCGFVILWWCLKQREMKLRGLGAERNSC